VTDPFSPRLRQPAHRVSSRAILWWTVQALGGWLALLVPATIAALFVEGEPGWVTPALVVLAVLAAVHVVVMPSWRFRVHRWEATGDAVYTQSGWLNQEWRVAPMSRIQTVDTERGPLQQLLGLSTVTVTTASAAGPLHVAGLDAGVASRLVEQLTATTQATPGDAT
jgi:membrane protein YdbS with pleckstrin-like domain